MASKGNSVLCPVPARQLSSAGLESSPNKPASGVLPSFLEVPSEVPGEEVLVQIKVTQIAPAAQNVVGDLQEAGGGGSSRGRKSWLPEAGEENAQQPLNQFHWRAAVSLHLEVGPGMERK